MTIPFPEHAWPLMKAALQHIADHPEEFYMGDYILRGPEIEDERNWMARLGWPRHMPANACGTVACLAGRIDLIANPLAVDSSTESALETLGLDPYDESSAAGTMAYIFDMATIRDYGELAAALLARFTFPVPLPEPSSDTAAVGG